MGNLDHLIHMVSQFLMNKIYVLICFDLADDPIALPSLSDEELVDHDAMMVDDDGE
jgi:hypothetical protein